MKNLTPAEKKQVAEYEAAIKTYKARRADAIRLVALLDSQIKNTEELIKLEKGEFAFVDGDIKFAENARKPHGTSRAAAKAMFTLLSSHKGRRFKAADLLDVAQGQKVRLLAYQWNQQASKDEQIAVAGGNRDREYYVE